MSDIVNNLTLFYLVLGLFAVAFAILYFANVNRRDGKKQ